MIIKKDMSMENIKALYYNINNNEGEVKFPEHFNKIDSSIRLNIIQDWILDLKEIYIETYKEEYPNEIVDENHRSWKF